MGSPWPGNACGFLILSVHAGFTEHRGHQRWHGAGRGSRGKSYRPAAIGAIKRCFTNRTGEQHGIQARPIHRHGRPDVGPSHGLTSCGMIGADVGRIGDRTSTSGGWVRQK
jgi:hypothetical protein